MKVYNNKRTKIDYEDGESHWETEKWIYKWCCDEFKEEYEENDIEIINDRIMFTREIWEDDGGRTTFESIKFRYCPFCGTQIFII